MSTRLSTGRALRGWLTLAVVLLLAAGLAAGWRLGPGRPVSEAQASQARLWLDTERLLSSPALHRLPPQRRDELRAELETQRGALEPPTGRVLRRVQGQPDAPAPVEDLPEGLLDSARRLLGAQPAAPREAAVLSSIAAHRTAAAVELGADPERALAVVPEPGAGDALPAAPDGHEPRAVGEHPHPELALARRVDQAASADRVWAGLPRSQRPPGGPCSPGISALVDGQWWGAVATRHPSVHDGSPGMPPDFRRAPQEACALAREQLRSAALAQIAHAGVTPTPPGGAEAGPSAASVSRIPGQTVLVRLSVEDAGRGSAVDALPGLEG